MKTLLIFAVGMMLCSSVLAFTCPECKIELCEDPGYCEYGVTKDACGCCSVCYQGPGEYCGGPKNLFGVCAEGYNCIPVVADSDPEDPTVVGTCVKHP